MADSVEGDPLPLVYMSRLDTPIVSILFRWLYLRWQQWCVIKLSLWQHFAQFKHRDVLTSLHVNAYWMKKWIYVEMDTFMVIFKWISSSVLTVYIYHEFVQTSKTAETTTGMGAWKSKLLERSDCSTSPSVSTMQCKSSWSPRGESDICESSTFAGRHCHLVSHSGTAGGVAHDTIYQCQDSGRPLNSTF